MLLLFSACTREEPTDLQVISRHFWKMSSSSDSVLTISTYKETARYTHYWVSLHPKPYAVDTGLLSTLETVDNRTIYQNKMQRVAHDYRRMLRKGIIRKVTGPVGGNEFAGYLYIFRKDQQQQFRVTTIPEYFEVLHRYDVQMQPKTDEEQDRIFEAAGNYFFGHLPNNQQEDRSTYEKS